MEEQQTQQKQQSVSKSEVANILAQINAEYAACKSGMTGFADTARHKFITKRAECIAGLTNQLRTMVGEETAIQLMIEQEIQQSATNP